MKVFYGSFQPIGIVCGFMPPWKYFTVSLEAILIWFGLLKDTKVYVL